ncbi:MAG: alkaline phosphatase [Nitrospirae bacterium]|nr:alkaline phosphatase [Nitrospirota bacterium]
MINKKLSKINRNWTHRALRSSINILLILAFFILIPGRADVYAGNAKYIILMVGDGWGPKAMEATNKYTGTTPLYQSDPNWSRHWVSTYPIGGSYDTNQAWSNFNYVMTGYGDSSACATSLYTGFKTANGRVTVSADASQAFFSLGERAKEFTMASGAISTVPISHATPGGWVAHNDDRGNTFAIADEGLFGDPNTTGTTATDWKYGGGHGPSPVTDVLIGTTGSTYVSSQILTKLRGENGQAGKHVLVERQSGVDAGNTLMAAANNVNTTKLTGLFEHTYHNADNSGYTIENPTLSESSQAALKVLSKNPNGFVLMIEGGAIDWAAHANNLNQLIGEEKDFDDAVQTVIDWVDDPTNDSNWNNTLVIITGDHDCGYLTAGKNIFPANPSTHANIPLGTVNNTTLAKEKIVSGTGGRRASWEDTDGDSVIDAGETVYWYWHSGDHTNSLIPLYTRGAGSDLFAVYETGNDTVRGAYLDETAVFNVMDNSIKNPTCTPTGSLAIAPDQSLYGNPIDLTSIVAASDAANLSFSVRSDNGSCTVNPNGTFIDTENYSGTITQGTGTFTVSTSKAGFYGANALRANQPGPIRANCPAVDQGKEYEVYFSETGTYTVWTRNWSFDQTSDSIFIGLDGNCSGIISQDDSSGATWNQWIWTKKAMSGTTNTINVTTPGLHKINIWIREADHRIDGLYITKGTETPTDASHGVQINPANCVSTIFTGDQAAAQSLNTAGWTNGIKQFQASGEDVRCLVPITSVSGTFTFNSTVPGADSLLVSNNTAIASVDPIEGDAGLVMQRFRVDSNSVQNGQVVLTALSLSDEGTAADITDAKVYISTTSSAALPPDAVLIGSTGVWDGTARILSLNGGATADRTVTSGTSKYIYIVYDTTPGEAGNTIQSRVATVFVASPDLSDGNAGSSNLLTIDPCNKTGAVAITSGQTLNGSLVDLTSIVTATNAANVIYTVTEYGYCDVNPGGTFFQAEKFNSTISQGTGSFSFLNGISGFFGEGYLRSVKTGTPRASCPAIDEGKEYIFNFPVAGQYKVWMRGYTVDPAGTDDSVFYGLDGNCIEVLTETENKPKNAWVWTNTSNRIGDPPAYPLNIASPGIHTVNIWVRENDHVLDGIYLTTGTETPTDSQHGIEMDPTYCPKTLFSGNATQAQTVNATNWSNGVKTIQVTADDAVCGTHMVPVSGTFTFDRNNRPVSSITDPVDGATLTSSSADPYVISGTASDDESVNHIEVSTDGGQTWQLANCPNCAGASVNWTYSWTLPANGTYVIKSKATDNRGVASLPSQSVTVTVFRGGPSITSTIPANGTTAVVSNAPVTIIWDRDVDCSTVTNPNVTISPAPTSWNKTSCSGSQAVFTPGGQSVLTTYNIAITTAVKDTAGNPMAANYQFSYTTGEPSAPASAITGPLNGSKINSSAPNPYTVTGTANDNNAVQKIEVSTNEGGTWNLATCSGCGTASATWTYAWTLPADGTYTIRSRATDTSNNVETPSAGNTVIVDRTSPSVSSTIPANGSTGVAVNASIAISWNTNIDCATVSTATVTSNSPNWTRLSCNGNLAMFGATGQAEFTLYNVTVTTGVRNAAGIYMSDNYQFSYRTNKVPSLSILQPDGAGDSLKAGNPFNVTYTLDDPDHVVTAAFYYDTDNTGYNGTAIAGACASAAEGAGITCAWDTTGMNSPGMPPKTFYIYGITNDGFGDIRNYSSGPVTIYPPNEPPVLSISEPNSSNDTVVAGDTYNITYVLTDPNIDDTVTAAFYFDTDNTGYDGNPVSGACASAPEGTNVTCPWNTTGMTPGAYYVYGITGDSGGTVKAYSPGQVTIVATNSLPAISVLQPDGIDDAIRPGDPYNIVYTLSDIDETVTARFYYDVDTDDTNGIGTLINECSAAPEGTGVTCTWINTAGLTPGIYYIYGRVQDRTGAIVHVYSGPITTEVVPPSVISTAPANGAAATTLNGAVTINWNEAVNCAAVNETTVTISPAAGWTKTSCSGTQAVFTPAGQAEVTAYTITVTTAVTDIAGNHMTADYLFSYTTADVTGPSVTSTSPSNGTAGTAIDSAVTINWNESVNCAAVNETTVTISPAAGWTKTSCSGTQAVFTPAGQADSTVYTVNVTTAVTDTAGNPMSSAYQFSYTTNVPPSLSISKPDGTEGTVTTGDSFNITYTLSDPDNTVTAVFYYDTDKSGFNGTAIAGACALAAEGSNISCAWNTAGMQPGSYYIYGITGDGSGSGSCATRTWTGLGIDNLASNAQNWSGNTVPQNWDNVIFDGTSVENCDWDINASLSSLSLNSGYSGTVSVNSILLISGDLIVSDGILIQNENITVGSGGGSCSGGSQVGAYSPGHITINNAGITVTPASGLVTTEAGGTDTFTVKLNSQPSSDVTVALSSSDTTEGTVSPSSLTFTTANWNLPQTVTVTGVNDFIIDGSIAYTIVTAAATSTDINYNGLVAPDVSVTNTDNDVAGITVNPTNGLSTTEAGGTATFTVVLNNQPTADVTIGLSISDTTEGTVSPSSLTFTPANWNISQTATITGVDDSAQDGEKAYTIMTAAATSADVNFNGVDASDVSVTNTDNDVAGITVNPTSGLSTTEAGGTATFTVVLNTQPSSDVTIALSSSDESEGAASPPLTFTSENWNLPQTVTVTGEDDFIIDGSVAYTIVTAAATSADINYNGLDAPDASVTNTDNDVAGITVNPTSGLSTTEAGGTATFTVVLNTQPSSDVTVALSSSDTTEGTVSPSSLTFTTANWNLPQTVTVTGVNDFIIDGSIAYTIVTAAATSTDINYNGLVAPDVSVTNTDNDVAGITVNPTAGLSTTEAGGTAAFTVVLNNQPTADVTIGLSSSDTTEGTVSPSSLTFTTANWDLPQTVTVTGVNDITIDGNITFTIETSAATSPDLNYNGIDADNVSVTNSDNDAAGMTITPLSGLTTTEAGGIAIFTVKLNTPPTASVTIALSSSNTAEGTINKTSLTFTTSNWNTQQAVTITGVNDPIDDGNVAYSIVTAAATSDDINYNGVDAADVSVTNTDNDTAGIIVTPASGLVTSEGGLTATFSVVLNSQPTADVTIALSSSNTAEGNASPAVLTFTSANWNTAQTVTVTGANDDVQDGNVAYTIITGAAASPDSNYNGRAVSDVSVTNTDNDVAGVTVSPASGLTTTEAGGTATFTVRLNTRPTASVTIALSSTNTNEGTVSPSSLTFTSVNWSGEQTVTVTGVNDFAIDGNATFTIITGAAASSDVNYSAMAVSDVSATNMDNDAAGVTVTPTSGLTTTESGGTATFTVVLNAIPAAEVTIGLNSSDSTEGTVSPSSLTFTSANWNVAQAVTVTGVDDSAYDNDVSYVIQTAAASSTDPLYSGVDASDVSVTNVNNDVPGITVTPTSGLTTTEAGGAATFTVVLNSQPSSDVTVGLSSSNTLEGNVSPASLTFTSANWSTPQLVTVTGANDDVADGNIQYTIVIAQAVSTDGYYNVINPDDVSVTNTNDDVAGIVVTPTSGLTTTEAGGTSTFTVVMNSQPTTDVTIALSSSDTTEGNVSPVGLTFTSCLRCIGN